MKTMDRRSYRLASNSRKSGSRSQLFSEAFLGFMLTAVAVSIAVRNTFSSPGPCLPTVVQCSILFCFIAYLTSVVLSSHHRYRRHSRLFRIFGFDAILLTLSSLLSRIVPPQIWLLSYILVAVFDFCNFFPLKWLYRRCREVGASKFFIRKPSSAHETSPPPHPAEMTNV